ncbi:MAG: hypothetical protein ACNS62_10945 [Candidatus Cyclobacteriaceae bacterium M3_2C_046]
MKKPIFVFLFSICFFSISHISYAQGAALMQFGGEFLLALLAGVILAFGFQALMTLISVAGGIAAVGPFNKNTSDSSDKNKSNQDRSHSNEKSSSIGPKISSAFGIWTMLTVSISLFFACWLSLKLILIESNTLALVLSLVIWAAFFTTMMYLEMKSVSSMAGGLFKLAREALKSSFNTAKSVFETGQAKKVQRTIDHSIDRIQEEVNEQWNTDELVSKLDEYVEKLQPEPLDYDRIEAELKTVLNEIEAEQKTTYQTEGLDQKTFINIAEKQPNLSKQEVKQVGDIFNKVKSANQQGNSKAEKVAAGLDKLTPGSEQKTAQVRQKVADYLRNTEAEEVQPEKLEHDLEEIINDPKSSKEVIMNRVDQMDKDTLVDLVKGTGDGMNDQKARKIVEQAEKALDKVKQVLHSSSTGAKDKIAQTQSESDGEQGEMERKAQGKKIDYEMKLRTFFNGMNRPEFNYEKIKLDFMRMFRDPKASPGIIRRRLQQMDRDSLITLISQKKNISRQDAENIFNKYDDARNQVIQKAEQLESQVTEKFNQTKQATLNQLEATRKTAATAAWWLVATAIVSGGAAVLGGILAIT